MTEFKDQLTTAALTASFGLAAYGVVLLAKSVRSAQKHRAKKQKHRAMGRDYHAESFALQVSPTIRPTDQSVFSSVSQPQRRNRRDSEGGYSFMSLNSRVPPHMTLEGYEDEDEDEEDEGFDSQDADQVRRVMDKSYSRGHLRPDKLRVLDGRMTDPLINENLSRLLEHLKERTTHHLGYPYNLHFKSDGLVPFLQFSINNLGDPFNVSNYGVHSRDFEIAVLDFFASLWDIKDGFYWGYITTCGTEGNLLGVLYGREKFARREAEPVLYCSKDTHYSVPKAGAMYRMKVELIETDETGEMIYSDLEAKLNANAGRPAVVSLNAGTTVKGAYDTVDDALAVLKKVGLSRDDYYVHVDGALNGIILPFLSHKCEPKRISFDKDIDSVSVSGHKMLGCPMPCGVVITRKEHMERWARDVEYLNSTDTTIMGSRNGQAALAMWVALQRKGLDGIREDVVQCIDNANYLVSLLRKIDVVCSLNEFSTTVVFERPPSAIELKWQLACTGDIAHVVVMPSVSKAKLRRFARELHMARIAEKTKGE